MTEAVAPAKTSFVADLPPAYFALVMATGILAIACQLIGIPIIPVVLFWINIAAYAALWFLTAVRIAQYPRRVLADLGNHQRGPGYFTTVAATSVVGVECVVQFQNVGVASVLWWIALALWLVLTYAVFTALTIRENKPTLADGINGGWLTSVVATQSLTVLGAFAGPRFQVAELTPLLLVSLWLAGGMLYIWMISLIFYRYTFFRFLPSDLMPPYWINMGAMAISTLGGALLLRISARSALLSSLSPFIKGFTLFYWATATWWIPMLLVLGWWRHVYSKVPLQYDPLYWGAVFPLGMYAVATFRLSEELHTDFLLPVVQAFTIVALGAWTVTFIGLLRSVMRDALATAAA
jgi:tellurite resistance protein TehA-like permease